ncbi:kinase-like domain-containing protein [Pholiota molesta]|nr:kinase-like domain-containing protein [Pholiota molesta]
MSLPYDKIVAQLLAEHTNADDADAFFAALAEKHGPHVRDVEELFWVDLQPFLLSRGYYLRERYHPDWKPSWRAEPGQSAPRRDYLFAEDSLVMGLDVLDAVRISDSQKVVLKKVSTASYEIPIAQLLSSPALQNDPRNHTVPVLDVIPLPADDNWALLVMPALLEFQKLPFRRVGEFCEAALQYLQALEFLHEHNVVHRDVCMTNLAMDISKVIPKGSHFANWETHDGLDWQHFEWKERWSVRPVQYYIIDFGISLPLPEKNLVTFGVWGRDKTVPEMSPTSQYNPFKVDVYQLGRVFLHMIDEYDGLSLFLPLAKRMTSHNPKDRPTAAEAVKLCEDLISKLSSRKLSRRIWLKAEFYEYCKIIDRFLIRFCGWNPIHL